MRIEAVYRYSWCTFLVKEAFSEEEWVASGMRAPSTMEHNCRGESNRHEIAILLGWKEVREESEDTEEEVEAKEGHETTEEAMSLF